jgi:poly-gamma-glutamate biosynthesis protein PgsC/CapC
MITLNLLALAIGIGLLVTLLVTEAFGIAAGGLVVPGYMALKLFQPVNVAITITVALATFAVIRVLSSFVVLYGRRMTALCIITAYLIGALIELAIGGGIALDPLELARGTLSADTETDALNQLAGEPVFVEIGVIGYIIPGLIALWFNRQGIMQTLSALVVTSVLVRLVLIMAVPEALMAFDSGHITLGTLLESYMSEGAL